MFFRFAALILLILFLYTGSRSAKNETNSITDPVFKNIFGGHYEQAIEFIASNTHIENIFNDADLPPRFMYSIVFPELIRFNAIQNQLETASLFTLYIQFGSRYSNFSIGPFQMKPEFAARVEMDAVQMKIPVNKENVFDVSDTPQARRERVKRLNSSEWQAKYLMLFVKILDEEYKSAHWSSDEDKMMFYAKAYNCGYHFSRNKIESISRENYFDAHFFYNQNKKYNYSAIALEYYRNYQPSSPNCQNGEQICGR
jgi:hypothetical protein